jgi:hypothetical protein
MSASCGVKCLFCNLVGRKDNVLRHCRSLHIFEETTGLEVINDRIRIVEQDGKHYAYCFGCKSIIKSRYYSLSTARQISRAHICLECSRTTVTSNSSCCLSVSDKSISTASTITIPVSPSIRVEPPQVEDNFKVELEALLLSERPDLFSGKNRRTLFEKVKQICKDEKTMTDLVDSAHKERDEFETKYNEETGALEEKLYALQEECDRLREQLSYAEKSEQHHIQLWRQTDKELHELRKSLMKI